MISLSNILCNHTAGNEDLRYGHTRRSALGGSIAPGASEVPRPVVVWGITRACNLRCVHCYASATPGADANELTYEEGIALLDDLKAFNVPAVLFSGGEPLARPDCLKLIAYAKNIGLRCTLSTNGLLIDDATADRLAEIGLQYVGVSIDGVEKRHDKLRGQAGAFRESLAAIDRCVQRGIKVGIRFTVHALNQDDLESIFDLCLDHDIKRLCIYHLAYAGRGGRMQKVDLSPRQTCDIMARICARTQHIHATGHDLEVLTVGNHADAAYLVMMLEGIDRDRAAIVEQQLRGNGGNRSGCNIASIDPVGNVHYDQFSWHYSCGNIRKTRFSEIWKNASDPRLAILRDRKAHLPVGCQSCRFLPICNGNLRTRAEAATSDWLGEDPSCYINEISFFNARL